MVIGIQRIRGELFYLTGLMPLLFPFAEFMLTFVAGAILCGFGCAIWRTLGRHPRSMLLDGNNFIWEWHPSLKCFRSNHTSGVRATRHVDIHRE